MAEEDFSVDGSKKATCLEGMKDVYDNAVSDVIAYINEYGGAYDYLSGVHSDDENNPVLLAKRDAFNKASSFDVVVFAKEGCGFCARAKALLYERQETLNFTMEVSNANDSSIKSALGYLLKIDDFTFPQIIINGYYVGGADNLSEWDNNNQLPDILAMSKPCVASDESAAIIRIPWYAPLLQQSQTPDVFMVPHLPRNTPGAWYPRNWPFYSFQWCLYANLVRYISFLQICLMVPAAILFDQYSTGVGHTVAYILLVILLIDLSILVLLGPSPFSPTGLLSTYFLWKIRGNATASVPYKVVWAAYIGSMLPVLIVRNYHGLVLALVASIINSTILVVLRF